ncbi:MAG: hypothetical protein FWD00_02380 [Clostridiales bacterium]|nr:hypothetical protein [Clostridiales bacterium]
MVSLLIGRKGTGKTKRMIDFANESMETAKGSIVFIKKSHRAMYDLKYRIRVVCMEEYEGISNSDEYIGFIYGIISSDHDIEKIYIDSIVNPANIQTFDLPEFLKRLNQISETFGADFIVSISAEKEEMAGIDVTGFEILN